MKKGLIVSLVVLALAVAGCGASQPPGSSEQANGYSIEQALQRLREAREHSSRGYGMGELNEAIGELAKAIELNPYGGYYYLQRGNLYRSRAGLYDTVEGKVEWTKGKDDERIKDCDRAIADYTRAIELYFYSPPYDDGGKLESCLAWSHIAEAYGFRGICHQGKGEYRLAIDDLTKAIEYLKWGPDPVMVEMPLSRAFCFDLDVSDEDIWSFWIVPLPLSYDRSRFLIHRSVCYEELGEYSLAVKDLEEVARVSDLYRNHCKQVAQQFDYDASLAQEMLKKLESKAR